MFGWEGDGLLYLVKNGCGRRGGPIVAINSLSFILSVELYHYENVLLVM
jgi:hypothetical protein